MDKRGVTQHIEMIIATVLFIAFFFFIFVFVKPYDTDVLSESLIDGLKYGLEEKIGTEVVHLFVYVNNQIPGESFSVDLPDHIIEQLKSFDLENCVAFDLNGDDYFCEVQNDQKMYINSNNLGSYNVLFSSQVSKVTGLSAEGNPEILIGGDFNQEVYSYNLLLSLKTEYSVNYEVLKQELGFPGSYDFSITSNVMNLTREIPRDVEILGKEFVEEVLYPNGTIINERFLIRIW